MACLFLTLYLFLLFSLIRFYLRLLIALYKIETNIQIHRCGNAHIWTPERIIQWRERERERIVRISRKNTKQYTARHTVPTKIERAKATEKEMKNPATLQQYHDRKFGERVPATGRE